MTNSIAINEAYVHEDEYQLVSNFYLIIISFYIKIVSIFCSYIILNANSRNANDVSYWCLMLVYIPIGISSRRSCASPGRGPIRKVTGLITIRDITNPSDS